MIKFVFVGFAIVVVAIILPCTAYGQPDWQFTRQNDAGVFVSAEEYPIAGIDSSSDVGQDAGDILVNIVTNASATDPGPPGSAFAQSMSMAQAMNLTPVGATTFLPTVDTTINNSSIASASLPEFLLARVPVLSARSQDFQQNGGVTATSDGSYVLDGVPASGFLHRSMYLFGAVNGSESATGSAGADFQGDGFVQAKIEGFFVEARYFDITEQWGVDVSLPGVTESFFTASLNLFFTFTIPITLPRTIDIDATSSTIAFSEASADATLGGDATAQGIVNLSASAWAAFTPTSAPLPDADFDGDGDVDGDDFLTFQRGFGESMGATLSQGDADHNGVVDNLDLAVWETNYGTQLPLTGAIATSVPEPTTSAIAMAAILLVFSRIRFHGDPQRRRPTSKLTCEQPGD